MALQNTGSPVPAGTTLLGCNTALLTTAAHGYTETLLSSGIRSIANATTGHGPQSVGGTPANTFTYFMITGATGNTTVNSLPFAVFRVLSPTTFLAAMPATGTNPTGGSLIPVFLLAGGTYNLALGPNCTVQYNPDNNGMPYQDVTRQAGPTPLWRTVQAVSTTNQLSFDGAGGTLVLASGGAGTSQWVKYGR